MNYTKNYHLPQWAEDDRILRTDFNAMCANIDDAIANAAAGGSQTQTQAWNGLLRAARQNLGAGWPSYDQTQVLSANGMIYNPLASAAMAASLSGVTWKSGSGICTGGGDAMDETILRSSCIDFWPGNSGAAPGDSDDTSVYRFTAPVDGVIKGCAFFLYTDFTAAQPNLSMTVAFIAEKREPDGTLAEFYRKLFLIERSGTETKRQEMPLELNIPIEKDAEYRLKISLERSTTNVPVPGRFGFVVDRISEVNPTQGYTDHSKFTVTPPSAASGSHTRTFSVEGTASHALVMLHYRKSVQTSAVTPTLGGNEMTLLYEAQRTGGSGGAYQEAWFVCEGSFAGNAALRVDFKTDGADDLCLLRYAAVLM